MPRLPPETFRLPVDRLREGYYSDQYFNLTRDLLEHEDRHPTVLMQVFQKQEAILGGIDEAIAVLREAAGHHRDGGWESGYDDLAVHALHEGDPIAPHETVMTVEGDYGLFAHLETVYLGCMARRTLVMRNVRAVVQAAHGKPILFFPARHDHWLVQTGDGWAAHVAGAIGVSTDAQASWWGGRGVGTVPHGLIAAYGGDTVAAARAFADRYHGQTNITVLVDFENDSVRTALEVAEALGERLWGVRLDTSESLVDRALEDEPDAERQRGVTAAARPSRARGARRGRPRARADRRLRRLRRRQDRPLRGRARAGRRLRRRLVAAARARTTSPPTSCASTAGRCQGRPQRAPESAPHARDLDLRRVGVRERLRARVGSGRRGRAGLGLRRPRAGRRRGRVGRGIRRPGPWDGWGDGHGDRLRSNTQQRGDVPVRGQLGAVAQDVHGGRLRQRAPDRRIDDVVARLRRGAVGRARARRRPRPTSRRRGRRRRAPRSRRRRAARGRVAGARRRAPRPGRWRRGRGRSPRRARSSASSCAARAAASMARRGGPADVLGARVLDVDVDAPGEALAQVGVQVALEAPASSPGAPIRIPAGSLRFRRAKATSAARLRWSAASFSIERW